MAKEVTPTPTKTELLANIVAGTGLSKEQVAAVLEALAAQIKKALGNGRSVARTIIGLAQGGKKASAGPATVKVTVVPELLPGPDEDCIRSLHTYYMSPATNMCGNPVCGLCGKDEIDWGRLHRRDLADVAYAGAQLKTDRFRYKRWAKDLDEKALRHAARKGLTGLEEAARKRIKASVGPAEPFRDGNQTPFKGNIIYYGQHATATCCRKCIEVWHGIPKGRDLTEKETDYLVAVLMEYISFKLPALGTESPSVAT
jgi:hypothetical protein